MHDHSHGHSHDHAHGGAQHADAGSTTSQPKSLMQRLTSRSVRLAVMLTMTTSFFFVELIFGYMTNSLSLVADAFHMLSDLLSLIVGLIAIRLAKSSNFGLNWTFGWARAEIVGALINGVFLLGLCLTIFMDAIERFTSPEGITNPKQVLIVGGIGLAINVVGLFLFHEHGHGHSHGHGHDHSHGKSKAKSADTDLELGSTVAESRHASTELLNRNQAAADQTPGSSRSTTPANLTEVVISDPALGDPIRVTRMGTHVSIEGGAAGVKRSRSRSSTRSGDHARTSSTPAPPMPAIASARQSLDRDVEAGHAHDSHSHHDHDHDHDDGQAHEHTDLNMRGVFLHVAGDALGSIAVMISAGTVLAFTDPITNEVPHGLLYLDPACSMAIVVLLLLGTIPLVRSAATILLQVAPPNVDLGEVRTQMMQIPGVVDVHELHIWQLDNTKTIATVHVALDSELDPSSVTVDPESQAVIPNRRASGEYRNVAAEIKRLLHGKGVHSTTVQPEFVARDGNGQVAVSAAHGGSDCMFQCPSECAKEVCCAVKNAALADAKDKEHAH